MPISLSPHKTGLALGGLLAIWHAAWSFLVALGLAQFLIDWVFRFHFISPPYRILPFDAVFALCLVIVTSIAGYIFGSVFAIIWNAVHKTS